MARLKLYYVEQGIVTGYDTYSDMVVAAYSPDEARLTHPAQYKEGLKEVTDSYDSWPGKDKAKFITVKLLGNATKDVKPGVICASFHAG